MRADLRITATVLVPAAELAERFSHSSGPGGQSVNTADSRVELRWDIAASPALPADLRTRLMDRLGSRLAGGVLTVVADEHRSQWRNRQAARARLVGLVRAALAPPPPPRRPSRPSAGAREQRLASKRHRAEAKRRRAVHPDD